MSESFQYSHRPYIKGEVFCNYDLLDLLDAMKVYIENLCDQHELLMINTITVEQEENEMWGGHIYYFDEDADPLEEEDNNSL